MAEKTHTVKVTGITTELLKLADERARHQHFRGRAQYIRHLIQRDVSSQNAAKDLPRGGVRTISAAEAVFARIEARDTSNIQRLANDADSRTAIYGDRA